MENVPWFNNGRLLTSTREQTHKIKITWYFNYSQ